MSYLKSKNLFLSFLKTVKAPLYSLKLKTYTAFITLPVCPSDEIHFNQKFNMNGVSPFAYQ